MAGSFKLEDSGVKLGEELALLGPRTFGQAPPYSGRRSARPTIALKQSRTLHRPGRKELRVVTGILFVAD